MNHYWFTLAVIAAIVGGAFIFIFFIAPVIFFVLGMIVA